MSDFDFDEYIDFYGKETQRFLDKCGGAEGILRYLRARAEMSEEDAEEDEE